MMKLLKIVVITIVALMAFTLAGMWALSISPISWGMHNAVYQSDGVAIGGYDPVAYFDKGKPIKGTTNFSTEYAGGIWQFSSQKHLEVFEQDPKKYMPQAGGHCAFAVSTGIAAPCDGEHFSMVDGKLYLFSNPDVKTSFDQDPDALTAKVAANWAQ